MKYLIKDLSKLTGFDGARIRKWQERYRILRPERGGNGYWYYNNEDYIVLQNMKRLLDKGEKLQSVVSLGREYLLGMMGADDFSEDEMEVIKRISRNDFESIGQALDRQYSSMHFTDFVRGPVRDTVVLIGSAWEAGLLSVAEEHAVSRWLFTYIYGKTRELGIVDDPVWLVAVFPGDPHELGALMHYALLVAKRIPAKYAGTLSPEHIIDELKRNQYRNLSLSLVMPQSMEKIDSVRSKIKERSGVKKVLIGGRGYRAALAERDGEEKPQYCEPPVLNKRRKSALEDIKKGTL
ncbi:MAG: MerR family transcriptional regulator [Leptospiraceae bacterium]|nr:MerR family transcriptional regulator [Leptospiraceae bacterium]